MNQEDQKRMDAINAAIHDKLLKGGAIGARLISAVQVNRGEYILKLQTTDDRRLEVIFTSKIHFDQQTFMEIKHADANQEQSTGRKSG